MSLIWLAFEGVDAQVKPGHDESRIVAPGIKHRAALSERGLNFADASIVFAGPTITVQDTRRDYGETRLQTDFLTAESRWSFGRRVKKPGTLSR